MPQQQDPPREAKPPSPLMEAVLRAQVPRHDGTTPGKTSWRRNFDESLLTCVSNAGTRGVLQLRLDSIERISRPRDDIILSGIDSILTEKIAASGEDAVFAFLDAMWAVSLRARAEGRNPDETAESVLNCASKLGKLAENLGDGKAFAAVCSPAEHMKDFRLLSKYINYMVSASGEIRCGKNPSGAISSAGILVSQAKFVAERANGQTPEYIGNMLMMLITQLNKLACGTP
ncbi:MAG: hypothetical protein NTY83_03430 [Candidatus Micrarchaeota archaeon]|nr:hypothetical protein [Candidatus Micrarchaeota archaeon]